MRHGITELEWNDYIDRWAAADVCDRIEAHLFGCLECWEFYEQVARATRELFDAAEEARQRITPDDRQLHIMLSGVFSRIRTTQSKAEMKSAIHQVKGRLNRLEAVLAPFCGPHGAVC